MAFLDFEPIAKHAASDANHTGVSVSSRALQSQGAPNLSITFKPFLSERIFGGNDEQDFNVLIGSDDDHGKIRLQRVDNGKGVVKSQVRKAVNGNQYQTIRLRGVKSIGNESQSLEMVDWKELEGGVVEIRLPKWADAFSPKGRAEAEKRKKILNAGRADKEREERERLEAEQRRKSRGI